MLWPGESAPTAKFRSSVVVGACTSHSEGEFVTAPAGRARRKPYLRMAPDPLALAVDYAMEKLEPRVMLSGAHDAQLISALAAGLSNSGGGAQFTSWLA